MTRKLSSAKRQPIDLSALDASPDLTFDQSDESSSLVDAMLFQMSTNDGSLQEQRRIERERQHLQMKIDEKIKDRQLLEKLAQIKAEERQKDRLSAEKIARLKLEALFSHRQMIIHEANGQPVKVSLIERQSKANTWLMASILVLLAGIILSSVRIGAREYLDQLYRMIIDEGSQFEA